MRTTELL